MNAPPFPLNPSVGQRFGSWVWNGGRWVCSPATGIMVNLVLFTASGPYQPSVGLVSAVVECWGGGGGGGPCGEGFQGVGGGGGGGSGGYSKKVLPAALVLGGVLVTVGVGGAGGNTVPNDFNAEPGTLTSFGAFCLANGGGGAQGNISSGNFWGQGGVGAAIGVGDFAVPGNPGDSGTSQFLDVSTYANADGGRGGIPPGGSGGAGLSRLTPEGAGNPGLPGAGPAAGGSGAVVNAPASALGFVGGQGGPGLCMVTEYIFADASDDGCDCGPGGRTLNVDARVAIERDWEPRPPHHGPHGEFDND